MLYLDSYTTDSKVVESLFVSFPQEARKPVYINVNLLVSVNYIIDSGLISIYKPNG